MHKFHLIAPLTCFIGTMVCLASSLADNFALAAPDENTPSVCYGTATHGHLENGKRLPYSGINFRAYHISGYLAGRTYMHSVVRDVVSDAYAALAISAPELRFVYGESGLVHGGSFPPHRTHRNGTSVDFMVPLRNNHEEVTELETSLANRLGYDVRFDDEGHGKDGVHIDFEAIAKHLIALDKAAQAHGIRVQRVILEPPLQKYLFAAPSGQSLSGRMNFMKTHAWFRHDQHYHIDFEVPCR
jgi:penicillin-insensitive murein DD-endopeptidase